MTVACVLRSGGRYSWSWVNRLHEGVVGHLNPRRGARFVCLTDCPDHTAATITLKHNWPGWWSKVEVLRPGLFSGPTMYLDLDSVPVGDLADLLSYTGELALLSDFNAPGQAQSGVMLFNPGEETHWLWYTFTADPEKHMARYRGDGEWLNDHAKADRIQDLYPGQVVSYKRDVKPNGDKLPPNARIVCHHGALKQDTLGWVNPWEA